MGKRNLRKILETGYLAISLAGTVCPAKEPFSFAQVGPRDVSPTQPVIPGREFEIGDFGAVPDGKSTNTEAFRRATAAIDRAGGGALMVPAGVYLTGWIDLCSHINLHLEAGAVILFEVQKSLCQDSRMPLGLIFARNAHDVIISGSGTIDGNGALWWPDIHTAMRERRRSLRRPDMVLFDTCDRVRVEGIKLTNAPAYNLMAFRCQNVTVDGITIFNPADDISGTDGVDPRLVMQRLRKRWDDSSPNTDGIDPVSCEKVLITHCLIDTGDDCIAVTSDRGIVSRDTLISDCTFLHGHGCVIGSGELGGVRNLTVRRCTFEGTDVGLGLESARDRGGLNEDLFYSDLVMKNVGEPIVISSYYPIGARFYKENGDADIARFGHDKPEPVTATTPRWHNIHIENIRATCLWEAGLILGLPEMPIDGVTLENINIDAPEGIRMYYAKNVDVKNVHVKVAHGLPFIVSETVHGFDPLVSR
jgi:polygalacturonase